MYTKLIQIIILVLVAMVLIEGIPELSQSIQGLMAGSRHSSPYNLAFWTLILIGLFSFFKNTKWGGRL